MSIKIRTYGEFIDTRMDIVHLNKLYTAMYFLGLHDEINSTIRIDYIEPNGVMITHTRDVYVDFENRS